MIQFRFRRFGGDNFPFRTGYLGHLGAEFANQLRLFQPLLFFFLIKYRTQDIGGIIGIAT